MRAILAPLIAGLAFAASAQPPHPSAGAAQGMRAAAERLLVTLPEGLRDPAKRAFEDRDRLEWHYTPRNRNGLALKALDARGRAAVHALLREALSPAGYRKVTDVIDLERVLREIEMFGWRRDPENYHLTVYGAPDRARAWGWRFEGHHVSLNFTLAGERVAVDAPSFLGANPASVTTGPRKGLRALGAEEDAARALLASLSQAQGREAVFDTRTYGDILTSNDVSVNPLQAAGILGSRLDAGQRELLWKLIEVYARTFAPGLAEARLARAGEGGIEAIRFGWAGSTERGRPHYYRVQGPRFLIEYDASQADGNHVHAVWRDFTNDFGRDLLREHYRGASGSSHRH